MPSSISSSERPGLIVRETASDRPGVAQPVPERDIPDQPWHRILVAAVLLAAVLLGAWEWAWRAYGAEPGLANDNSHFAQERRRIDAGEGNASVLIGDSRVLFDIQLDVWQKVTGHRPIQLALEGTSGLAMLDDLAADPAFTGKVLIGVAPDLFFTGFAYRADAIKDYHRQGPSGRIGHWLSQHLIEPYWAFFDGDFALAKVVARLPWPQRPGEPPSTDVRKLSVQGEGRNTQMWHKVVDDPAYRQIARNTWSGIIAMSSGFMTDPVATGKGADQQIARAVAAIGILRTRGVKVLFLRSPSIDNYNAYEEKFFPRARTWDLLLARTGVAGIHFADHPQLQSRDLPEWSHLSPAAARLYTAQLAPMVEAAWATKR